jgi:hypothetical protein
MQNGKDVDVIKCPPSRSTNNCVLILRKNGLGFLLGDFMHELIYTSCLRMYNPARANFIPHGKMLTPRIDLKKTCAVKQLDSLESTK